MSSPPSALECPICLGVLQNAVETSCGHAMCSSCFVSLWNRGRGNQVECPIDRSPVRFVVPSYTLRALIAAENKEHKTAQLAETHRQDNVTVEQYNLRFEGVFALRQLGALPHTLGRLLRNFGGLSTVRKGVVILVVVLALLYLLSGFDLIPDALGLLGMVDDFFVLWIVVMFLSTYTRVEGL